MKHFKCIYIIKTKFLSVHPLKRRFIFFCVVTKLPDHDMKSLSLKHPDVEFMLIRRFYQCYVLLIGSLKLRTYFK